MHELVLALSHLVEVLVEAVDGDHGLDVSTSTDLSSCSYKYSVKLVGMYQVFYVRWRFGYILYRLSLYLEVNCTERPHKSQSQHLIEQAPPSNSPWSPRDLATRDPNYHVLGTSIPGTTVVPGTTANEIGCLSVDAFSRLRTNEERRQSDLQILPRQRVGYSRKRIFSMTFVVPTEYASLTFAEKVLLLVLLTVHHH